MAHALRTATVALALLGGAALALAAEDKLPNPAGNAQTQEGTKAPVSGALNKGVVQGRLTLTTSQKQKIASELAAEQAASADFRAAVGDEVPQSIALRPVPMTVATEIPAAKPYSYAKLSNNDIVLVDPKQRTVAAVIQAQASTTGNAPPSMDKMDKK